MAASAAIAALATPTTAAATTGPTTNLAAAATTTNSIIDYSDIGIGVIQQWDHNYRYGHYDAILGARTSLGGGLYAVQSTAVTLRWNTAAGKVRMLTTVAGAHR